MKDIEIKIDHSEFITIHDLNYIISSIDTLIIESFIGRKLDYEEAKQILPTTTFVGISGVKKGSIVLEIVIGMAVYEYVAKRFVKGFKSGSLGVEIQKLGKNTSDYMGGIVGKINGWAESEKNKDEIKGTNIKKITAKRINKDKS